MLLNVLNFHENESCSVVSNSVWPYGLYSPWNSSGQNTGVGSLSLLQGIFPTQRFNPGLPHCRQITYQLSHKGNPIEHHRIQSFHHIYSKWTKTYFHKKTCTQLFIATSFGIAKRQKWLRCSSTSKCCNKLYDLSIEYHSIRKENDYWYKKWPG